MGAEPPLTSTERSRRRRAALRAQGLRPVTFWLPDTSTPEFKAQAARACAAIDRQWNEDKELRDWVDAMNAAAVADIPPPEGWD